MKTTPRPVPLVIAWEGNRPIYATGRLLDWRRRAAAARERIEALPEGEERTEAEAAYLRILCE